MNVMRRIAASGPERAQTVFQVLLIIACIALALAVFFPIYEYYELYRGDVKPYKFDPGTTTPVGGPAPTSAPAAPAAAAPEAGKDAGATTTTVPAAAPAPAAGAPGTTVPAKPGAAEAPKPAAK